MRASRIAGHTRAGAHGVGFSSRALDGPRAGSASISPSLGDVEIAPSSRLGWDGAMYREFESFLDRKGLRPAFPTVDSLTPAMGAVSLYHQGRRIENVRMSNVADGYAINGWEAQILENHSGVVDCFRNPKSDPAILAYFNQPLYVAVTLRNKSPNRARISSRISGLSTDAISRASTGCGSRCATMPGANSRARSAS